MKTPQLISITSCHPSVVLLVFYKSSSPVVASHGVIPWWASRRSNRHQRATSNKVAASSFAAFWIIIIITIKKHDYADIYYYILREHYESLSRSCLHFITILKARIMTKNITCFALTTWFNLSLLTLVNNNHLPGRGRPHPLVTNRCQGTV